MGDGRSEFEGREELAPPGGSGPASELRDRRVTHQAPAPLELAVPTRVRRASVDGAPLRAAFLLSHVDDRTPIGQIALSAQLPRAEVIESFLLLVDLGLIELRVAPEQRVPTHKSGMIAKTPK